MTAILEARTAQDSDAPATPIYAAPIRHPSAWTVADFRSPALARGPGDAAQTPHPAGRGSAAQR